MPPKNIAEIDKPEDVKRVEPSAVDKVKTEVTPKTDPLTAIKTLLQHVALEFGAVAGEAPKVEALAEQFGAKAKELAEATLAGVEAEWAKVKESHDKSYADGDKDKSGGVAANEREQPNGLKSPMAPAASIEDASKPHNAHAIDRAVEHGMDPALANQMTTHGSNS